MATPGIRDFEFKEATCSVDFSYWMVQYEAYLKSAFLDYTIPDEDLYAGNSLLQCCGHHIQSVLQANDANYMLLPYSAMKAILIERYLIQNERIDQYRLACMRIEESESLQDYIARLRPMASVINKVDSDKVIINKLINDPSVTELQHGKVLDKLLKPSVTLKSLIEWSNAEGMKNTLKTNSIINSTCLINRLEVPKPSYRDDRSRSNSNSSQGSNSGKTFASRPTLNKPRMCYFCGYDFPHRNNSKCPALNAECGTCRAKGHYTKCCPTITNKPLPLKRVRQIQMYDEPENDPNNRQVSVIRINSVNSKRCPNQLVLLENGVVAVCTMDTGAEINVLSTQTYKTNKHLLPKLKPCEYRIMAYNSTICVPTLGKCVINITWQGKTQPVEFVVIDSSKQVDNLISFKTMTDFDVDFNEIFKIQQKQQSDTTQHKFKVFPLTAKNRLLTDEALREFILKEYGVLFEKRVGLVPNFEVTIPYNKNMIPIKCPPQFIAMKMLNATKGKLDKWQNDDIVEPISYSNFITWISSLNPVEKEHGKPAGSILTADDIRITCNCKNVNKAILREPSSLLPNQQQIEYDLNGAIIFSKLDVRDAFSMLPLSEETKQLFTFSTPWGLYRLKRLVQGVCVSSEIYQQYMTENFKDIRFVKTCIDDFLIYGKCIPPKEHQCDINNKPSLETQKFLQENIELMKNKTNNAIIHHNDALFKSLDRCLELNMTLNADKCQFGITSAKGVTFYGNHISKHGFKPTADKMEAFKNSSNPNNKSELRSLLGMATHLSKRLPEMCQNTPLLNNLLKKYEEFNWTEAHTQEVKDLKATLICDFLRHFDETLETHIYVDAGPHGIGTIMTQIDKEGKEWLIACGSHAFSDLEKRFSQVEKETLAPVWALLHYKYQLLGNDNFTIYSDNEAVVRILSTESKPKPTTSLRILSWISKISGYTYKIRHVPGKLNIADYVSRCHNSSKSPDFDGLKTIYKLAINHIETTVKINSTILLNQADSIKINDIITHTESDVSINEVKEHIINGKTLNTNNKYHRIIDDLSIHDTGLLMKDYKIVLPESLQNQAITIAHLGHLGVNKCIDLIRRRYYFNNIDSKIRNHIKSCIGCEANTGKTQNQPMIINDIPKTNDELYSIDFSSKTPSNNYILAVTNERSRYKFMKFSRGLTSKNAIDILSKLFKEIGYPQNIKSDNGPAFRSAEFARFCTTNNINHIKITPLYPPANGLCENSMKLINKSVRVAKSLSLATNKTHNWQTILDQALKAYRAATHNSTGYTPNELMGYKDEINLENYRPVTIINENKLKSKDLESKEKSKHYNDLSKHAIESNIVENDLVLHKWLITEKYQPRFDPIPYKVIKLNGNMAIVQRPSGTPLTRNLSHFKKFETNNTNVNQLIRLQQTIVCCPVIDPLLQFRLRKIAAQEAAAAAIIASNALISPQTTDDQASNIRQKLPNTTPLASIETQATNLDNANELKLAQQKKQKEDLLKIIAATEASIEKVKKSNQAQTIQKDKLEMERLKEIQMKQVIENERELKELNEHARKLQVQHGKLRKQSNTLDESFKNSDTSLYTTALEQQQEINSTKSAQTQNNDDTEEDTFDEDENNTTQVHKSPEVTKEADKKESPTTSTSKQPSAIAKLAINNKEYQGKPPPILNETRSGASKLAD
jgi:hypothetical protein